ncbi:MAG: hypothetical protein AUK47_22315 [Deltaproteobacteria bacterium CG2_30_63_29]|nr:MAG: hypothetical protein AUK47_22315 [Deltaproteobacteria bacterium CG2_30_63_29]PJB34222.1 MAG: hypothetical protein CO108_28790 [Deltaproteobacteria bacterium CG_4_9_14_3_um_filter_63_12]
MKSVVVLGPQVYQPFVGEEVQRQQLTGRIAMVTAGWQEDEPDDSALAEALAVPSVNLRLYARWEEVISRDTELMEAHRRRQDQLVELQALYQMRLRPAMKVARQLLASRGPAEVLDPERENAIDAIRRLDAHHLARVIELRREFDERYQPHERPAVFEQRAEVARILAKCQTVAIAGGHIVVLLNRLRMLLPMPALSKLNIIAWSAGAMALSERVVLFHDHPAQGVGDAELLDSGLGLIREAVLLPHARGRLKLKQAKRVSLMARRFAPALCYTLDGGDRLEIGADDRPSSSARVLSESGVVETRP